MLFELSGVAPNVAREALQRAAAKLPIGTKIVAREEADHEEKRLDGLRDLTSPNCSRRLATPKSELFNLRFALRTGHLTDFSKIRAMRRSYAQIQTVISEKRIAEEKHGAA